MNWFWRLFGRGAAPTRDLFRFHDGRRWRLADPVAAWDVLEAGGAEQLLKDVRPADGPAPVAPVPAVEDDRRRERAAKRKAAAARLADLACEAFGVEAFDGDTGRGMTLPERIALVTLFLAYIRGLAVAARPLPGGSAATG